MGRTVLRWMIGAAIVALCGWLYVDAALRHSAALNTSLENTDQAAYLEYAVGLHQSGASYIGPRNQMPLYPFLQSLVYDPQLDVEGSFARAKAFSIALSVALLAALFLVWRRRLTTLQSVALLLVTGFTVFLFRAAYVQAELLYYALSFGTFLLLCRLLVAPSWPLGVFAGSSMALTHLAKGAMLPCVALFVGVGSLRAAWIALRSRRFETDGERTAIRSTLSQVAILGIVVLTFLVTLSPYLITSKRVYGRAFYSTPSTFYMWYDDWADARSGVIRAGDRFGWPGLAPDAVPGPLKYLREHTPRQIAGRLVDGLRVTFGQSVFTYGYWKYVVFYALVCVATLLLYRRWALDQLKTHFFVILFAVGYLGVYTLSFAWYARIAAGNRMILSLFLPFMYAVAYILREALDRERGAASRRATWLFVAVHAVMIGGIVLELNDILTDRIVSVYGGE